MFRPRSVLASLGSAVVLTFALSVAGFSQNPAPSQTSSASGPGLSTADQKFLKEASQGGQAEVELGQMAEEKGQSPEVKAFGKRMVTDHSKANDQLKQLATQKNVDLPAQLASKDQKEKERLSKMSGSQFDKAYMNYMVADHKADVAEFKKEATSAHDSDVKNFAQATLPTLESHLQQAESIAPNQNASSAKTSTTANNSKPQ